MSLIVTTVVAGTLACNLTGQPDLPTAGPTQAATVAPTALPQPTPILDAAAQCPEPTQELALHVSLQHGFCFLYPAYFEIGEGFERPVRVVQLIGPPSEPIGQKVFSVILSVEHNGPDEGMTDVEYADRVVALNNYPPEVQRESRTIAGQPASILFNLPGAYVSEQRAHLVANGSRYVISLIPQPVEIPDLTAEANLAWSTVLDSLVLFPPQSPPDYVDSSEVCPSPDADTKLRIDLLDGYCYLYPSEFEEHLDLPDRVEGGPVLDTVEGFDEVRTSLTLGTFGSFPGSTPRQVLEPRLDAVDPASISEQEIGGWPAVVFRNPGGPWASRDAIIVVDGFVYTIVNQPWEPTRWPEGIAWLDRLWDTVIDSTAFFTRWR